MLKVVTASTLILIAIVLPILALDPLAAVERDQADRTSPNSGIFNGNIALNNRSSYTQVSSYKPGAFGQNAHDGDDKTAWVPHPGQKQALLELSWGLPVPVNQVEIQEKNNADIRSLSLELYDGKSWEPIVQGETRNRFKFPERPASALRIRIETDGKDGGIAEVGVFNTRSELPLPRYGAASLVAAMQKAKAVVLFDGSPYAYSRFGRTLINEKRPEACLADEWTRPVIEFICTALGGEAEPAGPTMLKITLNGRSFTMDTGAGIGIVDRVKALAEQAGLEFARQGDLVMIGDGLKPLSGSEIVYQLNNLIGRNPYLTDDEPANRGGALQAGKSRILAFFESVISGIKLWVMAPGVSESAFETNAVVTPTMTQEGSTYQWAGFRSTADPLTNADAWLKYSGTKAVRPWVGTTKFMNSFVRPAKKVETPAEFEELKAQIRTAPESNNIIAMRDFLRKHHSQLSAEFGTYNALEIDVINQTGPKDWPDNMHDDFINWAATYALTYYLAKNYGVSAHQYGNEPDPYFNKSTDQQIARRLTLVADAVHCAIDDVNRDFKRGLKAVFSAPVLASDFTGRSARIMMRNLYTRYDGSKSSTPLFQLFNRHRYGGRPHQNALEVRAAKEMMQEEAGEVLPQVFTELNYSTGGNWSRPTTKFLNDTPAVFTSIASIWGVMMQEQGVFGIFIFNLNNSGVWFRKAKDTNLEIGPFSNTVTYSMYPERDAGTAPMKREQIAYGTKNFEVSRLFGRGFHGSRPLLKTEIACADPEYRAWTTFDKAAGNFYIWSVQVDEFEDYGLEFDLSKLDLPPNALLTAETVSGARHGEVTLITALPEDRKIRLRQAPQSAMLLTVHQRPFKRETIYPEADATVVQGEKSKANFGAEPSLRVGRNAKSGENMISFLKFRLPEGSADIQRAVLELQGRSSSERTYDGGFLFRVYAVDGADWDELKITAESAPSVNKTVSALKRVDLKNYPAGHVTCFDTPTRMMLDVTPVLQEARRNQKDSVDFVLIREVHWPEENTDSVSAVVSSREAGQGQSPKLQVWE